MSKLFRDIQYFFVTFTVCINYYIADSAVPIDIVTMKITHELQPPRPAIIAMIPDKVPIITRKHDQKGQRKLSHEGYKIALIKIANINTSTYERTKKDEEEKIQELKHFAVDDEFLDNVLKGFKEITPRATNINNTFKREKRDAHATKQSEILKKLENVVIHNPKVPLTIQTSQSTLENVKRPNMIPGFGTGAKPKYGITKRTQISTTTLNHNVDVYFDQSYKDTTTRTTDGIQTIALCGTRYEHSTTKSVQSQRSYKRLFQKCFPGYATPHSENTRRSRRYNDYPDKPGRFGYDLHYYHKQPPRHHYRPGHGGHYYHNRPPRDYNRPGYSRDYYQGRPPRYDSHPPRYYDGPPPRYPNRPGYGHYYTSHTRYDYYETTWTYYEGYYIKYDHTFPPLKPKARYKPPSILFGQELAFRQLKPILKDLVLSKSLLKGRRNKNW